MASSTPHIERSWPAVEVRKSADDSTTETGRRRPWTTTAVAIGAPLTLAIVEMFHPHPHDLLNIDQQRWLMVHYARLALFPSRGVVANALDSRENWLRRWPMPRRDVRVGHSWWPSAFLTVSAFGLLASRTHGWPGGPVTFGALAIAASIIQREAQRQVLA